MCRDAKAALDRRSPTLRLSAERLEQIRENDAKSKKEAYAKNLEAEKKVNEAVAKKVADKKAALAAEKAASEAAAAEAPAEEAPAEE